MIGIRVAGNIGIVYYEKLEASYEKLSPEDKNLVKTFLDAFITKKKIQQLAL